MRGRLRFGAAVVLFGWTGLFAAESPAPKPAGKGEPLVEAKRDYESLKALKSERFDLKAPLPSGQGLMDLQLKENAAPDARQPTISERREKRLKRQEETRSKNWLLDAVEARRKADETKTKRDAHGSKTANATAETAEENEFPESEATVPLLAASESGQLARKPETEKPRMDEATVANPLGGFMASWMTPRDFELLQRASRSEENAPPALREGAPTTSGPLSALAGAGGVQNVPSTAGVSTIVLQGGRATNPYLSLIETDALPSPSEFQRSSSPSFSPPSSAMAPDSLKSGPARMFEPLSPPPATKPSEQFKPADDGKYFKQLKRF